MRKKAMVVGSNSFSGGHFVDLLLDQTQYEVVGMSRSPEKSDLFLPYKRHGGDRFKYYHLNLNTQMGDVLNLIESFQPELIVNFSAQGEVGTSWKYPEQWFETNAVAIARLGNFLKDKPYLKRYVHVSTPEVYGTCQGLVTESAPLNPSTPYAASKAAGDLFLFTLVKQYQFPLVMIRSTNVYGKHQQLYRIIPRTMIYLKMGRKIPLHGGGKSSKSYIHIRDVCRGILSAAHNGKEGEIYHLSSSDCVSIRELVEKICRMMGHDFERSVEIVADRPGQDARYSIDSSKAGRDFSWSTTVPLESGLQEMQNWIENDWKRIQNEPLDYIHLS